MQSQQLNNTANNCGLHETVCGLKLAKYGLWSLIRQLSLKGRERDEGKAAAWSLKSFHDTMSLLFWLQLY